VTALSLSGRRLSGLLTGWPGLARFWGLLVGLLCISGSLLQALGPSPAMRAQTNALSPGPAGHGDPHRGEHGLAETNRPGTPRFPASSRPDAPGRGLPGRDTPGPVADPDPALLEPYGASPTLKLPRIASDGRTPMSTYAAGFDPSSVRPKVGILIAGIGMTEADSMAAAKSLPGGVTLVISPYAGDISHLLAVVRMTEHEYLLAIPMEPQGYPVNDPDDRYALMTSLPPAENLSRLQAILVRQTGYVGVTNVLGQMQGERLSGMADQLDGVLEEVAQRGLLFIDGRTGQAPLPHAWNRSADIVLDTGQINAAVLDQRLDDLTHIAQDRGSALGIVSVPRPLTLDRIAAWTNTLAGKGVALAPVSALVRPPVKQDFEK
jgi:polysaccharide deacetylase 2 family uncharacterized protein YibQ